MAIKITAGLDVLSSFIHLLFICKLTCLVVSLFVLFSSSFNCRDGERSYWDNVSVYSKYIVCLCVRLLTHGVHVQRSPPRVGAVVLVVLTGRLSG